MVTQEKRSYPVIGIILGDGSGVGPEIVAKLAKKGVLEQYGRPVILGDPKLWEYTLNRFNLDVSWHLYESPEQIDWEHGIPLLQAGEQPPEKITFCKVCPICGKACIDMIQYAVNLYLQGKIQGVCYAPLNKAAMKLAHNPVASETELFALYLNQKNGFGEINMLEQVWTTRVTSHIPLREISDHLSIESISESIRLADCTLKRAGYKSPLIGVCALNPHGGEGGLCGDEEIRIIGPAVQKEKNQGICVSGPYPADTLFQQAFDGKFPEDQERVEKHPLQEANSVLTEFDEELHNKTILEEGKRDWTQAALIRYLKKKSLLTKELEERILKEKDLEVLEQWLDLAYDGASLEELIVSILKQ